jgi:hypothetical protein
MGPTSLENRIGVLEAVLGIDSLASEECSGDPTRCDGPCKNDACPMETSALVRMERALRSIEEQQRVLQHVILELEAATVLPPGTWSNAVARSDVDRLETHLKTVTQMLNEIRESGIVGTLLDEASKRKEALESEVQRARAVNSERSIMLKPIEFEENGHKKTLSCRHSDVWPPGWSKSGQAVEALRAQGLLDAEQYERAKTWERVCGLHEMNASKCLGCPNAMRADGLPVVTPVQVVAPALTSQRKRRKK